MYRAILVPLDGSAFGEQALPVALGIAQRAGATVYLVHVHMAGRSAFVDAPVIAHASLEMQARATERAYLDQLAQRVVRSHDVHIESVLLDGPVADALVDHLWAAGVDLVVMSTHGRGALGRLWHGSIAAALVRQAPAPLLLVRPDDTFMQSTHEPIFRHVLVPLDGSPLAEQAIKPAITLGALMRARYVLLQALDPLVAEHTHPPYAVGLDLRLLAEVRASATAYLEHVATRLHAQSLEVQTTLVVGTPALAIREYTHAHGGVSRLLLGSVADAVVHTADVSVLLYRPPDLGA